MRGPPASEGPFRAHRAPPATRDVCGRDLRCQRAADDRYTVRGTPWPLQREHFDGGAARPPPIAQRE